MPMIDFTRRPDESDLEYQYRISAQKDVIGTWQDVADVINTELHQDYTESKYRKDWAALQKVMASYKPPVDDEEALARIDEATSNLRRERRKLEATKLELDREERRDARMELFYENVREAFDRLPPPRAMSFAPRDSKAECVLTISDLHYGATFKSQNNEYSRKICEERLWQLLADFQMMKRSVGRLHLVNLGDTLQGILRMRDLQINDIPVVEAVVEISRLLAKFLNELSRDFDVDYYHCIAANHTQTRPLGSKAGELASEDLEKIIVCNIEDSLRDNPHVRVHYDLASDYIQFNVMGFNCVATHGHQLKHSRSNIMDGLSNMHGTLYDYVFIGHDHSAKEEIFYEGKHHNREVLTCPGFIGSDPYSDSLLRGCKPAAKFFLFDEKYGHIMSRMFLF